MIKKFYWTDRKSENLSYERVAEDAEMSIRWRSQRIGLFCESKTWHGSHNFTQGSNNTTITHSEENVRKYDS